MIKENNGFISLIKFILSILIVCYHSWIWNGQFGNGYFNTAYLATEVYFVISGFLMVNSYEKNINDKETVGISTYNFIKNRFSRLIPYMIVSFSLGIIVLYGKSFITEKMWTNNSFISELFLLSSTGSGSVMNTSWWYLSTLLLSYLICYPLLKKYKDSYLYIIAPLIILISLCYVNSYGININDPNTRTHFFTNGFYQSIIYINLGVVSYIILKNNKDKLKNRWIITILELLTYFIIILNMHYSFLGSYINAILTVIAVTLSFSGKSYTTKIFSTKKMKILEKIGIIIFLNNCAIRNYLSGRYNLIYNKKIILYIAFSIGISIIIYLFMDILIPYIKNKIRRIRKNEI